MTLEDESRHYDDYDDEYEENSPQTQDPTRKRKESGKPVAVTILLLAGAVVLVAIFLFGKAAGLIGSSDTDRKAQQDSWKKHEDDGMVTVPDLVGKTEDEATALLEEVKLGKQLMGEETSTQEKGKISSQDIPQGTKVERYTTVKYYISKGQQELLFRYVSVRQV